MAASQPATPAKACELKVIPSRFEELPEPSRWGGRGGGSTHLPPRLGDIWLGLCGMNAPPPNRRCTATGIAPRGIEPKMNKRAGVCRLIYVCLRVGKREMLLTYSRRMNHGSEISPSLLLPFLIEIAIPVLSTLHTL